MPAGGILGAVDSLERVRRSRQHPGAVRQLRRRGAVVHAPAIGRPLGNTAAGGLEPALTHRPGGVRARLAPRLVGLGREPHRPLPHGDVAHVWRGQPLGQSLLRPDHAVGARREARMLAREVAAAPVVHAELRAVPEHGAVRALRAFPRRIEAQRDLAPGRPLYRLAAGTLQRHRAARRPLDDHRLSTAVLMSSFRSPKPAWTLPPMF